MINNVEALPHATLFWRSLTQWMGGMGIIVLLLAIIPGLGIEGRDLFVAEVPGPTHDKFTATFKSTARRMWYLYISLTAAQAILLLLGNMDLFDAICHSFTTMATGGYSTKQASIAYWDSAYIHTWSSYSCSLPERISAYSMSYCTVNSANYFMMKNLNYTFTSR